MARKIPFSVLDLCPVRVGETPREALAQSGDLARHVEAIGYKRYWLAEHHGLPTAASATSVAIGHVAGQTSRIRVGSGGVMLPNHVPFVIAEQFGTLTSLYPGRIDLGLGRSTGTDPTNEDVPRALRTSAEARERFPDDVLELQSYFREAEPGQRVRAWPGAGSDIPIWLLGSSTFSAEEAGKLGLPFAFATHIARTPETLMAALETYRSNFRSIGVLERPYAMVGLFVVAADTDEEAKYLLSSYQKFRIGVATGKVEPLPPPIDDLSTLASPQLLAFLDTQPAQKLIGSRETVHRGLDRLIAETGMDELIVLTFVHDREKLNRSFSIVAEHEAFEAAQ